LLLCRYQVLVDGSTAPMVVMPWPVQSPVIGLQPLRPKVNGVKSGVPELLLLRRNHCRVPPGPRGLTTPTVNVPSSFQSPTTGVQPGAPYWKGPLSGAPAVLLLRRYQVAVAGSKTPGVYWRKTCTVTAVETLPRKLPSPP